MLTEQQSCLLQFIESRLNDGDISPSFEEMRTHLGLRSKSGVHRLLEGLRERGRVVRLKNRARSLRVVQHEEDARKNARGETLRLPFLGNVAAGLPIEAVGASGWDEEREYPSELLGTINSKSNNTKQGYKNGSQNKNEDVSMASHYALQVEGDSMVEVGILDGDTVIVEACKEARDGELVIALVDDEEATLKILRVEGREIVLEAANEAYEAQRYAAGRVQVQGRVTGLMRRYGRRT